MTISIHNYDGNARGLSGGPDISPGAAWFVHILISWAPSRPADLIPFSDLTPYVISLSIPTSGAPLVYNSVDDPGSFASAGANAFTIALTGAQTTGAIGGVFQLTIAPVSTSTVYLLTRMQVQVIGVQPPVAQQETMLPSARHDVVCTAGDVVTLPPINLQYSVVHAADSQPKPTVSVEVHMNGAEVSGESLWGLQDPSILQVQLGPFIEGTGYFRVRVTWDHADPVDFSGGVAPGAFNFCVLSGTIEVRPRAREVYLWGV